MLDEAGMPLLVEGVPAATGSCAFTQLRRTHDVVFEGRVKTRAERLGNVLGIVAGAAKLIERARTGDPAESDSNARCTAWWLRIAADELDALTKGE